MAGEKIFSFFPHSVRGHEWSVGQQEYWDMTCVAIARNTNSEKLSTVTPLRFQGLSARDQKDSLFPARKHSHVFKAFLHYLRNVRKPG